MSSGDIKPDISAPAAMAEQDEPLTINPSAKNTMVWALKIPRFLLERWEQVPEAGVELGELVVDNSTKPPKVSLRLPDTTLHPLNPSSPSFNPNNEPLPALREKLNSIKPEEFRQLKYNTQGIPSEYEVNIPEERSKNTWVFNERVRTWAEMGGGGSNVPMGLGKRKREKAQPRLVGAVQHECQVHPARTAKYLKLLERRRQESELAKRPIRLIEDEGLTQGQINQLASGYTNSNSKFGKGIIGSKSNKSSSSKGDKYARLGRNELTDRLFSLFAEKPYWGIQVLRTELKQPDAWLREVLPDVAEQIREGVYKDQWQLKGSWRYGQASGSGSGQGGEKEEKKPNVGVNGVGEDDDMRGGEDEDENDEDDDDDDDDMEEVGVDEINRVLQD